MIKTIVTSLLTKSPNIITFINSHKGYYKIYFKVKRLLLFLLLSLPTLLFAQGKFTELSQSLDAELNKVAGESDKKALGHTLGNIGGIYLSIAKLPPDSIIQSSTIPADKKGNLNKSIEYSNKSIAASTEAGDIAQLKTSYRNLNTAQKMAGRVKDAVASYAMLTSLKKGIFGSKKANEIEKKQIVYENTKRIDSLNAQQRLSEQLAEQKLQTTVMEKETVNKALQKTQTDLSEAKNISEEKDKQLTIAEQQKALLDGNLLVQQKELQIKQKELEMKDKAIRYQRIERYFYILGCVLLLTIAVLAYSSSISQKKLNRALSVEKKRSEDLLLNILPAEVAAELMQKGFADAKHFSNVSVLFTDFISFTTVAETMTPQQLVGELHICFKAFDGILDKYHIEKIKTVGDAYMAVSGLPLANPNHASDVVAAAIEIKQFMVKRKKELGKGSFNVRIGINSGEVVAGIVGVRKFSYDIWGDTVNIAARMEQNSENGKINISDSTYQLVKDKYPCLYRGKIEAKNKGSIDMYYVEHNN